MLRLWLKQKGQELPAPKEPKSADSKKTHGMLTAKVKMEGLLLTWMTSTKGREKVKQVSPSSLLAGHTADSENGPSADLKAFLAADGLTEAVADKLFEVLRITTIDDFGYNFKRDLKCTPDSVYSYRNGSAIGASCPS